MGFGPQDWDLGLEAGIWASRLRYGPGGWGRWGKEEKEEEKEKTPHMCESIGHRPLWGRCPIIKFTYPITSQTKQFQGEQSLSASGTQNIGVTVMAKAAAKALLLCCSRYSGDSGRGKQVLESFLLSKIPLPLPALQQRRRWRQKQQGQKQKQ